MFGRKRHTQVIIDSRPPFDPDALPSLPSGPLTPNEAIIGVHASARQSDLTARLYLILADDVNISGRASEWNFYYLMPKLHAEALITVTARPIDGAAIEKSIKPVPEPGSMEEILALLSPEVAHTNEEKWQKRLSMLQGLPMPFIEPAVAIEVMQGEGAVLFSGGAVRMKARTLPDGMAVWEAATSFDCYRVPLRRGRATPTR